MHKPEIHCKLLLAITFCAVTLIPGCGRKETSALSENETSAAVSSTQTPAELPIDQQTEQKLDPLTESDVQLYLKVMLAAADRVKNPLPADKSTLDDAKTIFAASARGHLPTPTDVKTLERANLVAISMDQIVAEDMKLDGRTYRGIAEAVESVVPNPSDPSKAVDRGAPASGTASSSAQTPLEERIRTVNSANEKFLMPYRDEIQRLVAIVRDPAKLPK